MFSSERLSTAAAVMQHHAVKYNPLYNSVTSWHTNKDTWSTCSVIDTRVYNGAVCLIKGKSGDGGGFIVDLRILCVCVSYGV